MAVEAAVVTAPAEGRTKSAIGNFLEIPFQPPAITLQVDSSNVPLLVVEKKKGKKKEKKKALTAATE
ncbi:hypothetical protein POVWA2_003480 [Plasmodium ovale wallikeri]|uniref:Uncharacterized protein n=1 Tax=Plasmodium ovale wallikeri TaxID=864142 RepID=A0A1A8YIE2_PLAOA|nr:hypothetical protein POVWA1_003290 [Plasmodium ovale wallikeri]SBT31308.1 hypothetical protein POVWA2_003480 [Plasmodium ovale wallikeri]